jgi:hypothetical protein
MSFAPESVSGTSEMESKVAEALERLSREAAMNAEPAIACDAAKAASGLPVQCDMSGVLVLTPRGAVLHWDPERGAVTQVTDPRWEMAALVKWRVESPRAADSARVPRACRGRSGAQRGGDWDRSGSACG